MRVVDIARPMPSWLKKNVFPDGQVNFTILDPIPPKTNIVIYASLVSGAAILETLILLDCLERHGPEDMSIDMRIGYAYGGRSDREFGASAVPGQVVSTLIGGTLEEMGRKGFKISLLDPHSVSPGMEHVIKYHPGLMKGLPSDAVFIVPDAGARRRVAAQLGRTPCEVVECAKIRDSAGRPYATIPVADLHRGVFQGRTAVIVDDICDGGRTFIAIAEQAKRLGARSVELRVTHAIFSNGLKDLFRSGIDKIVTTDSFPNSYSRLFNRNSWLSMEVLDWREAWPWHEGFSEIR